MVEDTFDAGFSAQMHISKLCSPCDSLGSVLFVRLLNFPQSILYYVCVSVRMCGRVQKHARSRGARGPCIRKLSCVGIGN